MQAVSQSHKTRPDALTCNFNLGLANGGRLQPADGIAILDADTDPIDCCRIRPQEELLAFVSDEKIPSSRSGSKHWPPTKGQSAGIAGIPH